jgi:hypothetical protein
MHSPLKPKGCGDHCYPLSLDAIRIDSERLPSPEVQHHRNTTFAGRQKLTKEFGEDFLLV